MYSHKNQLTQLQSEDFAQFLGFSSSSFPLTALLRGSRPECCSMHHNTVICGEDNVDNDNNGGDDNNSNNDNSFDDDNNGDDELMRRLKAASSVVIAGSPAVHVAGKHDHCCDRGKNDNDDCNEENDDDGDDNGDNEGMMRRPPAVHVAGEHVEEEEVPRGHVAQVFHQAVLLCNPPEDVCRSARASWNSSVS